MSLIRCFLYQELAHLFPTCFVVCKQSSVVLANIFSESLCVMYKPMACTLQPCCLSGKAATDRQRVWLCGHKSIFKSRRRPADPALPTGTHPSLPQSTHLHCPEPQLAFCPSLPRPFCSPTFYTSIRQRLKLHLHDLRLGRACGGRTGQSLPWSREISQAISPQLWRDTGAWPPPQSE